MGHVNYLMDISRQPPGLLEPKAWDTALWPQHQPIRELCTSKSQTPCPSLTWASGMLCWNPWRSSGILSTSCPGLLACPCNKHCPSFPHLQVSAGGLYCTGASGPMCGLVTVALLGSRARGKRERAPKWTVRESRGQEYSTAFLILVLNPREVGLSSLPVLG